MSTVELHFIYQVALVLLELLLPITSLPVSICQENIMTLADANIQQLFQETYI